MRICYFIRTIHKYREPNGSVHSLSVLFRGITITRTIYNEIFAESYVRGGKCHSGKSREKLLRSPVY